jgi:hypothetical protein
METPKPNKCELCEVSEATEKVDYRDVVYDCCGACKIIAENE